MSPYQWIRKILIQFRLTTGNVTGLIFFDIIYYLYILIFFDIDEQKGIYIYIYIYYHKKYFHICSKTICFTLIFSFPFAYSVILKDLDIVTGLNDSFIKIAPAIRDVVDYIFMAFSYISVNVNRFKIQQELNELLEINNLYYEKFNTTSYEERLYTMINLYKH